MTSADKGQQRLGEQQPEDNIESENRAAGNFEPIGQRIIGAREAEADQDRYSDPMPVLGERRPDAPLAGVLVHEPKEPAADIAPRPQDDDDENGGHGHAIGEGRGGNRARRGHGAAPAAHNDYDQNGKPIVPKEAMGALVGNRRDPDRGQLRPQI